MKKRWVLINFPLFCEVTNGFYCKRPNWRNCQHRKMTKFLQEILRGIIWLYLLSAAISFEKKNMQHSLKFIIFLFYALSLYSIRTVICFWGMYTWKTCMNLLEKVRYFRLCRSSWTHNVFVFYLSSSKLRRTTEQGVIFSTTMMVFLL